jgi:hypothetical protein
MCQHDRVDGTGREEFRVSFPADRHFSRIGRVAVAGLALRLGFDVASVEQLRLAVDEAVQRLSGSGRITLVASWAPDGLVLELTNPDAAPDTDPGDLRALSPWLQPHDEGPTTVRLEIPANA